MLRNKFEKFSLSFASVLLVVVIVLGIKIKNDALGKENLKEEITNNLFDESQFEIQKKIEKDREEIMGQINNTPGEKVIEEVATSTETPVFEAVTKEVEVAKKKSDKETRET